MEELARNMSLALALVLTVAVLVPRQARRRRPGGQVAQAHRAVERLVAQGQRGHGAAAAAGRGSRRLSGASVRPQSASLRHCRAIAAFFRRFFFGAGGGGARRRPMGARRPRRRPRVLLFTCRILKGFSACRYGFSYASFTYGVRSGPRPPEIARRI